MHEAIARTPDIPPAPTQATDETMEFAVTRRDLLEELAHIQSVVASRTTVPILSNLLVQATGAVLQLTATDLDISLRTACPAVVKKPGACCIPARKLFDYVKLLPEKELTIKSLENNWIQIRSGRSNTKMVGLPRSSFPALPLFPREAAIALDADVLRNLIAKTIFSISREESRYTLNGALLVLRPRDMAMIATDGHRLAKVEYKRQTSPVLQEDEVKILIPHKALSEVSSLLSSSPVGQIQFAKDDSTLFFVVGNRLLTSRRLVGSFPNYDAVLPRDISSTVVLARYELSCAIRRVAEFSDERSNAVRIRLSKNELTISSSNAETGESEDSVPTAYTGDQAIIGFNSQYLLDFLKVVESANVRFGFKSTQTACELTPDEADSGDCRYRYVLMPMRV
ncbi:MAG TPA: DNA polymerase III subunit beta [Candidatus Angelobacter sp.]|nr:DNA polymerase III subunit beta [Candidatus Angelobacter sp.]